MIMGMQNMQDLEGFGKLIFLSPFIFSLERRDLRNIRDLNLVTCHTKEKRQPHHARILSLEQSLIF